jgi:hypothetical protein
MFDLDQVLAVQGKASAIFGKGKTNGILSDS